MEDRKKNAMPVGALLDEPDECAENEQCRCSMCRELRRRQLARKRKPFASKYKKPKQPERAKILTTRDLRLGGRVKPKTKKKEKKDE